MPDTFSLGGVVGSEPRHTVTPDGLAVTSFRLASDQRRFNKRIQAWETYATNWYTISAFRTLAINAAASITKGDRIVVSGRLRIRSWESGTKSGVSVEIDADALGHDLAWGTSSFTKSIASAALAASAATTESVPDQDPGSSPVPAESFLPSATDDHDAWAQAVAPLVALV